MTTSKHFCVLENKALFLICGTALTDSEAMFFLSTNSFASNMSLYFSYSIFCTSCSPPRQTVSQRNEGNEFVDDKSVVSDDDDVYHLSSGEEFEDESTIEEEELIEGDASHEEEVKALEEEG